MAPDPTPVADQYASLTCVMPECTAELGLVWDLVAPLVLGELEPDADPPAPGDAIAGGWRVQCLNGHVILVPGDKLCPGDGPLCSDDLCDHDHSEDLRQWRRSDVERLTALLRYAGVLPAEPDPFDHTLTVHGTDAVVVGHPDACAGICPVLGLTQTLRDAGQLPPPGRYEVGVGNLGDRLAIGDRIGGTDAN